MCFDLFGEGCWGAESGNDNDIIFGKLVVVVGDFLPGKGDDVHLDQLTIYLGVVNDFSNEKNTLIRKNPPGGVGQIDGTLHAVAEAKLLREPHRGVADLHRTSPVTHFFHDG